MVNTESVLHSDLLGFGLDIALLAVTIAYIGHLLVISLRETGVWEESLNVKSNLLKRFKASNFSIDAMNGIHAFSGNKRSLINQQVSRRTLSPNTLSPQV